MGRSPVVVIAGAVGLLIVVGLAVGPWLRLTELKQELSAKEQAMATLTSQNQSLQQQLTQVEDERKELETRVAGLRSQLASATEELGKLHDLQGRYDLLQNDKTRLEVEVTRLMRERNDANERLRRVEEENRTLEQSAARLRNRLSLLDRDYQQMAGRLEETERQRQMRQADPYAPITLPSVRPHSELPMAPETSSAGMMAANQTVEWRQTSPGNNGQASQTTTGSIPLVAAMPHADETAPPQALLSAPPLLTALQSQTTAAEAGASKASLAPAVASRAAATDELAPQTIELPPIIIRKSQAAMGLLIRGRVVEVNVPHRFVVIDQGIDQGVRVGMTFDLVRGNTTVGQAVVVRVRQGIAACDLVTSLTPDALQVGDLAIQRGP